ncbi:MAG: hypothetical protein RLZZ265_3812 [Verrucomicrobiota bacterium]|jgi:uncharacterized delta-60 repeat protein
MKLALFDASWASVRQEILSQFSPVGNCLVIPSGTIIPAVKAIPPKATRRLLVAWLWTILTSQAGAALGGLDPSFGTGGKVVTPTSSGASRGWSVALQSDGKILVVGDTFGSDYDVALTRYLANGTLDPTFGTGGVVISPIGPSHDTGFSMALQDDGKIIVGGVTFNGTKNNFALVRYLDSGGLDTSFGTGGKVSTPIGSGNDLGLSVRLQSDGKIVLAGYSDSGPNRDFALARYQSDGSLDASFGNGGKVTTRIGDSFAHGLSAVLQTDGKIIVAGYYSSIITPDRGFALARYTSSGALDTTFGTGGTATTDLNFTRNYGVSAALQSDGKVIVAGDSNNGTNQVFSLARFTPSGALDTSFGSGGKVTTPIGTSNDYGGRMALQSNGMIVLAGFSFTGTNSSFALARYTANGLLDTTFGTGGKVTTSIGNGGDEANGVALQSDGKIIVVGHSFNGTNTDIALARYFGGSPLAPFITSVAADSNGTFSLSGTGAAGESYVLVTATNLLPSVMWTPLATNLTGSNGVFQFTDPQAANISRRYYQLRTP